MTKDDIIDYILFALFIAAVTFGVTYASNMDSGQRAPEDLLDRPEQIQVK